MLFLEDTACLYLSTFFFFFNDTATTEIYTLSLHDALPISCHFVAPSSAESRPSCRHTSRSEEHTSELQSRRDLVCRLLLEKKKKNEHTDPQTKKKNQRRDKTKTSTNT